MFFLGLSFLSFKRTAAIERGAMRLIERVAAIGNPTREAFGSNTINNS